MADFFWQSIYMGRPAVPRSNQSSQLLTFPLCNARSASLPSHGMGSGPIGPLRATISPHVRAPCNAAAYHTVGSQTCIEYVKIHLLLGLLIYLPAGTLTEASSSNTEQQPQSTTLCHSSSALVAGCRRSFYPRSSTAPQRGSPARHTKCEPV